MLSTLEFTIKKILGFYILNTFNQRENSGIGTSIRFYESYRQQRNHRSAFMHHSKVRAGYLYRLLSMNT